MQNRKNFFGLRILLLFIMCNSLLAVSITASASGTKASFLYSDDYFEGDQKHAETLQTSFTSMGYGTLLESRPIFVYGLNQHLMRAKAVFLSTHGTINGSEIVLNDDVYFRPDDVITNIGAEFVFVSACYSAKTNAVSNKNLCSVLLSNGA